MASLISRFASHTATGASYIAENLIKARPVAARFQLGKHAGR